MRRVRQETYSLSLRVIHVAVRRGGERSPESRRLRNTTRTRGHQDHSACKPQLCMRPWQTGKRKKSVWKMHICTTFQYSPVSPVLLLNAKPLSSQPACPERRRGLDLMQGSVSLLSFRYRKACVYSALCGHRCCQDIWSIIQVCLSVAPILSSIRNLST